MALLAAKERMGWTGVTCIKKAERKGHTQEEVDEIIFCLFGYDESALKLLLNNNISWQELYVQAPNIDELARGKAMDKILRK